MKSSQTSNTKPAKQTSTHMQKPEIRDNLDSRKNEEQDTKGDDTTHNSKETRNNRQTKKS